MNKFVVCLFLLLYNCSSNKKMVTIPQSGSVSMIEKIYNSNKMEFEEDTLSRQTLFFRDSMIIYEVGEIQISDNIYNDTTISATTRGIFQYTFLDMRYKSFYDYRTFSDTALLLAKYNEPDTGASFFWKFYENKFLEEVDKSLTLQDTVMNNVAYKRFTMKKISLEPSDTLILTFYLNCNREKSMFRFVGNFSEKIGCPVEIIDEFRSGSRNSLQRLEIKYHTDTLTIYQHKVFDAWEKYAKKHPVK